MFAAVIVPNPNVHSGSFHLKCCAHVCPIVKGELFSSTISYSGSAAVVLYDP